MKPREHVWIGGAVAAGIFASTSGVEAVGFWTATVLIDVDHYLQFLYYNHFRDRSVRHMFLFHRLLFKKIRRQDFLDLSLFHTVEFLLGFYLLAAWAGSEWLMAALLGFIFHFALDAIYLTYYRSFFKRAYSIVEYLVRRTRMARRGDNPDGAFLDAVEEMRAMEYGRGAMVLTS